MRLLIDECLPRDLKHLLTPHDCSTVQEMGWSGRKNGQLLSLAEGKFDVLISIDQGLEFQQNLTGRSVSILIIEAASNKVEDLAPAVPEILRVLIALGTGHVVRVAARR